MKAFEARNILNHIPDDTEVTLVIGKLLELGRRSGDSSGSVSSQFHSYVSESDRPDGCGPYGIGASQDDR